MINYLNRTITYKLYIMKKFYFSLCALLMGAFMADAAEKNVTTLAELRTAVTESVDGDVIIIGNDIEISGTRLDVSGKSITIKGASKDVRLIRAEKNVSNLLIRAYKNKDATVKGTINLENITIDGNNVAATNSTLEASDNGILNLTDVKVVNVESSKNIFSVKGGGNSIIDGVEFADCITTDGASEVFDGVNNGITLKGVCLIGSLYVEKDHLIKAEGLQDGTKITLLFDPTNANRLASKVAIVRGCGNPEYIVSGVAGYKLVKEGNKDNLKIVEDDPTGIEDIEINEAEGSVEYFNLQGVRVENPANGLYIRRQGSKVTKVIIK